MALPSRLGVADAVFLDFDGTLVDIAEHPGAIDPPGELIELLGALRRGTADAFALVSGRTIADLDAMLAPFRSAAVGLHGIELRSHADASITRASPPAGAGLLDELRLAVAGIAGVWIEDKGASAAIHFRAAPHAIATCGAIASRTARSHGLDLLSGKMVFELRPTGTDKGTAVSALMAAAPFRGRRPVFVGDDVTDEDGFAVVQSLGGIGVKVGAGASTALEHCADVAAVRAWLRSALA